MALSQTKESKRFYDNNLTTTSWGDADGLTMRFTLEETYLLYTLLSNQCGEL